MKTVPARQRTPRSAAGARQTKSFGVELGFGKARDVSSQIAAPTRAPEIAAPTLAGRMIDDGFAPWLARESPAARARRTRSAAASPGRTAPRLTRTPPTRHATKDGRESEKEYQ